MMGRAAGWELIKQDDVKVVMPVAGKHETLAEVRERKTGRCKEAPGICF